MAIAEPGARAWQDVSRGDWEDWRWQMRNRIRDSSALERCLDLTLDERTALAGQGGQLPVGITPYYSRLIDPDDGDDPIRKTMVPRTAESVVMPWERADPLGEEDHTVAPCLVHTYPNKALLLVTDLCATYCRYCTRSRLVGAGALRPRREAWEAALAWLRAHPEINDVLLSGGDPFVLSDERLDWLLRRLRAIPHLSIIRIGTKIPVVLPQRITPELASVLGAVHPLWLSIHFTHPRELTPEVADACVRLADAGIPLMAQTVLLAGVNDDEKTLSDLFQGLLAVRVKPYYLHVCDAVRGSSHFKVPVARGLELVAWLHGRVTGYAVPQLMIDAPGGGGKVPVGPSAIVGREGDDVVLRNRDGCLYRYPDPLN